MSAWVYRDIAEVISIADPGESVRTAGLRPSSILPPPFLVAVFPALRQHMDEVQRKLQPRLGRFNKVPGLVTFDPGAQMAGDE